MTDHPSNPPSREPSGEWMYRAALTVHIVGRCPDLRHGGLGLKACGPCYRVADALAAQEARHKAELDGMREARDSWAGIAGRNAGALVEAESKLRECAARVKSLMDGSRCSGCGEMSTNCICGFRH